MGYILKNTEYISYEANYSDMELCVSTVSVRFKLKDCSRSFVVMYAPSS